MEVELPTSESTQGLRPHSTLTCGKASSKSQNFLSGLQITAAELHSLCSNLKTVLELLLDVIIHLDEANYL